MNSAKPFFFVTCDSLNSQISPSRLTYCNFSLWHPFFSSLIYILAESPPVLSICLIRLLPRKSSAKCWIVPVNPRHGIYQFAWFCSSLSLNALVLFVFSLLDLLYWHRWWLHSPPLDGKSFSLLIRVSVEN